MPPPPSSDYDEYSMGADEFDALIEQAENQHDPEPEIGIEIEMDDVPSPAPKRRKLDSSRKGNNNGVAVGSLADSSRGAHSGPANVAAPSKMMNGKNSKANTRGKKSDFESVLEQLREDNATDESQPWGRPRLPEFDPKDKDLIFQQIEIDEHSDQGTPSLRMYGVTQEGHSVLAHIVGFLPYFWVAAPRGFTNADCSSFCAHLNSHFGVPSGVVDHIIVANRKSLWGYRGPNSSPFIKLVVKDFKYIPRVRSYFENGQCNFRGLWDAATDGVQTFESNIAYTLRFMIDHKVVGMNWIEMPKGKYSLKHNSKISNCQLEVECHADDLISHAPEDDWGKFAPLRILSFDIECAGRPGIFPEADKDPVIQIANMVTRQGESTPFIRNVFTLNSCSHIVGTQVIENKNESSLLKGWSRFVKEADPDLIIGYNHANFDLPYLLDRAKALKVMDFSLLGRLRGVRSEVKEGHFSSKAYGNRETKETRMDGRLQLDLLTAMQRDYKLRSYTLNSVCAHFLGEQKEDVHHSIITELQNGGPEARRRLAVYCLKDAYLPQRLMDRLMFFYNYTEMARVTGIPFNYLLARGQQIKVISQLFRKANENNYLVPSLKQESSDEQYEGATVIEPEKGYYDVPIATLDFASLYPSIMMAHNLCYTTLLDPSAPARLGLVEDEDYIRTPNNDFFVKPHKRKGLLPTVLEDLLAARKRARADLKKETDPFKRAVLDGRQLALKISANSVYGFTGATIGKLPCLPISTSTTAYGRQMIEHTRQEVEAKYNTDNGYEANAHVIYGDTDSVMVKFGTPDISRTMELGADAAAYVSKKFTQPIRLEFEKIYYPYLLISKKRYAGLYWTKPECHDKMDAKGIETVRRDNCRLVQTVIETCLHKMLIDRDVKAAEEYTKSVISDLLQDRIDMSQLVITKALAKTDYAAKQAHVVLADRMKKRDAGSAPALGDRVAYVIVKGTNDARAYERSEDPLYVLENNIPIDTKYYLENQLSKPLLRIFEPILGDKAGSLLAGDHTRTISVKTPTLGGLMKFTVRTLTCIGCKSPLKLNDPNRNTAVCSNCQPKTAELYHKQLQMSNDSDIAFSRLWTQCQRCQGSLHQDVLCTSKDCPIFYMRKKAQKEVEDSMSVLDRFDGTW